MDNTPPLHTAADLEMRAARVADPSIDLKTKYAFACELREMIDTVREAEVRVLPHMIPVLLEILRSGEPSFQKESLEFQFRRSLLEILHRIPSLEPVRPQIHPLYHGLLYLLRHDNEEIGVTCCKMLTDLTRGIRTLNEDVFSEYKSILFTLHDNLKQLAVEALSEDSPKLDPNTSLPAIRSFKVATEMDFLLVPFLQCNRNLVITHLPTIIPHLLEFIELQAPAQQKAREDAEAMGENWAGMTPAIKNEQIYTDYILAQLKCASSLVFIVRGMPEQYDAEGEKLVLMMLRLFQDCPAMAINARKDLSTLMRHLGATSHRRALLPHIDKLLDERVLLGTSVGGREMLRITLFTAVADLLHHLRAELTPANLTRIFTVYVQHLHNPYLSTHMHVMSAKVILHLVEIEVAKDTHQNAARILTMLLEACVDKVDSLVSVQAERLSKAAKEKDGASEFQDFAAIEKSRPLVNPCYATEKPEDHVGEYRNLVRTILHVFRGLIVGLKKCDAPVPDGALIARMFDSCIRAMAFFDAEARDAHDAMDWLAGALAELNLHIFQEVWTRNIGFYLTSAEKRPVLMHLASVLFAKEPTSPTLVAIVLRHLVDRLPELGDYDDQSAAVLIRVFKMAFQAVTTFPQLNESILASHLGKLIMECFPLAAKTTKPANYFHLLRGLFRSIGGGGGRFELLYKEVLPLLPDMLEGLNRQLQSAEGGSRDMIVELFLTVPLRLTHLIPYLTYLMKPLALALRGTPDLVTQGLRTLELCIDNLTPDFLDPTLNTVLRDLMEALHDLLRPTPSNHHHAHTTIRILGKLGGRNRKLLEKEPLLGYRTQVEPVTARFSFGSQTGNIELTPISVLAAKIFSSSSKYGPQYRPVAYSYLEQSLSLVLHEGVKGREREELFVRCLENLYDALHVTDVQEKAEKAFADLSRFLFASEVRRNAAKDALARRYPSSVFSCYLDALQHGLARDKPEEAKKALELVGASIRELAMMATTTEVSVNDVVVTLHQIASRFLSLCLEEAWICRSAGCGGIRVMTNIPDLGVRWVNEREVDLVRMLLHVLKDMPHDLPHDADTVVDVLHRVLRVSSGDSATMDSEQLRDNRVLHVVGLFFAELSSPNPIVRKAAQDCIALLAELSKKSVYDLLMPHRDRMLASIYTKPLRALPFPLQIGMIEGIRYCVSLQPPLPELNDELLRLLHETLALADADDMALVGRTNGRQSSLDIIKLRVACIKLLTASMPMTDFFAKQHQTRQRVTTVYFKSLYSPTPEIKEVAHEGLRAVLTHQSRLPKELLQTGLRPILMNLADPKRLSIPGLEGLARLLELLTNYFKVEIGHKLLDHFRIVADPQMLQASSRLPLMENDGIKKLVCLANIFHLLPSAANIFLENLVNAIVQTESALHFSGESPFSAPLAKYLDRYPSDAMDYFMKHLAFPMQIRTLRSILRAKLAPNLLRELNARTGPLVMACLEGRDTNLVMPGLLLCSDLAELVPGWVLTNQHAVEAVLTLWRNEPLAESPNSPTAELLQKYTLMLSIFKQALEQSPRIDVLFDLVNVFIRRQPLDVVSVIQFLYRHVALSNDLAFRRNILLRFLIWFDNPSYTWAQKALFLQYIITPMLLVHATHSPVKAGLVDADVIQHLHSRIWQPLGASETGFTDSFTGADDTVLIEFLRVTTIMVQHYSEFLHEAKKDIIKCAWLFIVNEDPLVKHSANVLAARFFDVFDGPPKFLLRLWTGVLKGPHSEGRHLVKQALDVLAPILLRSQSSEPGYPQWAKTTRRLLAEDGVNSTQTNLVYHLIVAQPSLFFPVRALFIPHIVNHLMKLGLTPGSNIESRILSIELVQVIFDWEQKSTAAASSGDGTSSTMVSDEWSTPLGFRENMVSYLIRLATTALDVQSRSMVVPRALTLLRNLIAPGGWGDVNIKLNYFSRALEQNEFTEDATKLQAQSTAKVLQLVSAERDDAWFRNNVALLTKLVRKGMFSEDPILQDSLHPVVDRVLRLFPLPKEEDLSQSEISEFHTAVHTAISDNLRSSESTRPAPLRGCLLVLKTVVQVAPERIEPYCSNLMKLLSKLAKDHLQSNTANNNTFEVLVRILVGILEVCHIAVVHLGDQRKWLLSTLVVLVDKSKSGSLCRYMLDIARDWAMNKRDAYPTMKEKASLLQKMVAFEARGERGEVLFNNYLELIYDIYTDTSLRRSDLTTRLEHPFLLGCRATDHTIRERFIDLLDMSVPRSLYSRLVYIFGVQSWEPLADHNWTYLALHLLLGSIEGDLSISPDRRGTFESGWSTPPFPLARASSFIKPMQRLLFVDKQVAHDVWVSVFPAAWACLSRREQADITHHMITLLSKDYHIRQAEMRPNVITTLLAGIQASPSPMTLPPHLVKYLAKTFGAWHIATEMLESSLTYVREDEIVVRDTIYDTLAELYAELSEEDVFYGLWRRRSLYPETNAGIAFEQAGMWEQASNVYEAAQARTRSGVLPFSESEFCLWEDHWILSAEKLQHWDILFELGKQEQNVDLLLESAWRTKDWVDNRTQMEEYVSQLRDVATPRRRVFEAFIGLLKMSPTPDKNPDYTKILEDAMQLALRKWVNLPHQFSAAHIPLLQNFQQIVELQEAIQIFASLAVTTAQNLEKRSSDLKMLLQAWRERLPNICDDITIWSDLVAWRQNVFNAINKAYIPLITPGNQGSAAAGSTNTFGYRGYHETAWIINRFAHVARKHELLDVCFTSLNRIYTLPNIEISEAFLKLREQARCHYQKPGDLQAGLEVINNTNLMYFSNAQKAEFYTLKGMFHAKLNRNDDANNAFGQAVQLDMFQAKAWAAWGKYNDKMFKEIPTDMSFASNAVSCYLQAAGLYKNRKSRPLLTRVLWLLSVDDGTFTISQAFDRYKGDAAFWYWITLIPQLCLSISQREAKQARYILLNLAKLYPQALFFPLRTTKEDMNLVKRQATQAAQAAAAAAARANPQSAEGDTKVNGDGARPNPVIPEISVPAATRQSWELIDEIVQILKTAFPLLILTLETVVEQIAQRFKASSEEEIYRLTCMLLQDAMQQYIIRMSSDDDGQLSPSTTTTLSRLAINLAGSARRDYEEDFIKSKPTLQEYIRKLQQWRDKYERLLDARPRVQSLDNLSHYLIEFQYTKFDEVEVPGQYTEDKDTNQNFVRIRRFGPKYENCRSHGYCWRRLTIKGHDGSTTSFAVQLPSGRHCRREERTMQIFRVLNSTLSRKKETRKRNLHFHLPAAVSCAPNLRLLQNDSSYITLGDIYDKHCEDSGMAREEPVMMSGEKVKVAMREFKQKNGRLVSPNKGEFYMLKKELLDDVVAKTCSEDILSRYMIRTMNGPSELWRMRKEFALQLASVSFMTYLLCLGSRLPSRFHWSRSTGQIAMSEILPGLTSQAPYFTSPDAVPFRFTPNLQHLLGPILTEGILASGIMSIGRCLTEPENDLEHQLCLFARDEVMTWLHQHHRGKVPQIDMNFRLHVGANIESVVKRAEIMACRVEREQALQQTAQNIGTVPVIQTVASLISTATNPANLVKMTEMFVPWF
ncbi:atypical/PIKK/TRRAP protein kinase [Trametes gibbosa]|nr:atypical/PIKK/TRRAP protein kinase [Trametes gibbosa]